METGLSSSLPPTMPKAPTARTTTFARTTKFKAAGAGAGTKGKGKNTGNGNGNARWIYKTEAMKKYHLTAAELEGVPILATEPNPHDPAGPPATKYLEREVLKASQALGAALVKQEVDQYMPWLAMEHGATILRTKAVEKYKVKTWQLDRIKPVSEDTNPHNARGPKMRYYNVADVKALCTAFNIPLPVAPPRKPRASTSKAATAAASAEAAPAPATPAKKKAAAAPRAKRAAPSYSYDDDDYYQDGIFDGMSGQDAAEKFAELTGIVGPAMSYWQ
ncbi:hypothetical protein HMN09_00027900 [Mycena chlorophos]|uniref:Uncharacterized protein n=1 Tax=Mycena chlorophos TaxID=658473 RepID=A0A8H6WS30_MYCCL|nr:hypothetical protein HMN09_00027900 [Mycena chlorophos]